jgi:peptide/nickel transport system ATP-binding protein
VSPILEISDLSVVYRTQGGDVHAVEQVSLELNPGEVVGLCGESGSGKSTLAYGATRLLRTPALVTSGSVKYGGRRITDGGDPVDLLAMTHHELRAMRWREIAIVFQSAMNALNPVLRVQDQLLDAIHAHLKVPRREAHEKAAELFDLVGIPRNRLRSYPHELSGGMRQRVMIAMALATDPEVVIMDEPTTALDVVVQRDILAQIVELKERLGFAILFITHDLSLLLELADRIAVMYAGRLMETGASKDLIRDPAHPYTRGLLNSFPSIRGPRRELAGIPGTTPDLRDPAHPYTRGLLNSFPSIRGPRRELAGIPGTTPDLRDPAPGCPFVPRCTFAVPACGEVDMTLEPWGNGAQRGRTQLPLSAHLTACPIVTPEVSQEGVLS